MLEETFVSTRGETAAPALNCAILTRLVRGPFAYLNNMAQEAVVLMDRNRALPWGVFRAQALGPKSMGRSTRAAGEIEFSGHKIAIESGRREAQIALNGNLIGKLEYPSLTGFFNPTHGVKMYTASEGYLGRLKSPYWYAGEERMNGEVLLGSGRNIPFVLKPERQTDDPAYRSDLFLPGAAEALQWLDIEQSAVLLMTVFWMRPRGGW